MFGTKRGTQYGLSIYEMAVWNDSAEQETTIAEVTTEEIPTETPTTTTNDIKVVGYQISSSVEDQNGNPGGVRIVGQVEPTINNKKVEHWGLVYSLTEYNGTVNAVQESDMTIDSENHFVAAYQAGERGTLSTVMGDSQTANYYAMTMTFGGSSSPVLQAKYKVRAFAQLEDGTIVYSSVEQYSIDRIADILYRNCKMPTVSGHMFLYTNILKKIDPSYKEVDYNWGTVLVPTSDMK